MIDTSSLWTHEPVEGAWDRTTALWGGDNKTLWPWWDGVHNGLDFRGNEGEPVMAVRQGFVIEIGEGGSYGKYAKIGTASNHELYAHMSRLNVGEGDVVAGGQVVGYVGHTGNATGPHLHIGKRVPSVPRYDNYMEGWVNPLPFLWQWKLRETGSKLSDHWDCYHRSDYDTDILRAWRPPVIKLLARSYEDRHALQAALDCRDSLITLRNHPKSEQHDELFADPEALGRDHADWWVHEIARIEELTGLHIPRHRLAVEGMNEPHEWHYGLDLASMEKGADVIATYMASFAQAAERHNLVVAGPNLGVGWPGNGGIEHKPPIWYAYEPMRVPMTQSGGLITSHEYCAGYKDGQGLHIDYGLDWWVQRYLASYDTAPSWQHVFRMITETGIDNGVIGRPKSGWRNSGLSQQDYMNVLEQLDVFYLADPFVLGINIFSRDGVEEQWSGFDIRGSDMMDKIYAYAVRKRNAWRPPDPDPIDPDPDPPTPDPDPDPDPPVNPDLGYVLEYLERIEDKVDHLSEHLGAM